MNSALLRLTVVGRGEDIKVILDALDYLKLMDKVSIAVCTEEAEE